ncbi:hypothetical protein ED733_008134 [Metarhizium rileyi]|uniref:Fungal lipase-type domain-containing protein n=1 Tax=Metarhizium rileyi (strain RCEF 4871) TaxID=1649241 RepID=A0A5C6GMM5_METRR|nr:hypothetical protein ED733_008134 [Metarhizium rileyi]
MGFFSSKSKQQSKLSRPKLQPASLSSPPNVYASSPPHRPATAPVPLQNGLYFRPTVSQPQLNHNPSPLRPAPCPVYYEPQSQHYPGLPQKQSSFAIDRFSESMVDLAREIIPANIAALRSQLASSSNAASVAYDEIRSRFDNVMTLIDCESLAGHENNLFLCQEPASQPGLVSYQPQLQPWAQDPSQPLPGHDACRALKFGRKSSSDKKKKQGQPLQTSDAATSVVSGNYFSKVGLYANSKLPMNLPRLRLHMPTWPLLCLAAQYSHRVYTSPQPDEVSTHIPSSLRNNTKAMRIKSISMDHANTIVFAIRGTASFSDWAVNLNMAPSPPTAFLDDQGNYCHAGFLSVARKMVKPVAARLRQLLEEDPGRAGHSLLLTGHSAGGAIAALLYSHMLSDTDSQLTILAGCFKRIHCITFGAPPISLLPLETPPEKAFRGLFLSFINEGDPVARASKAYVRSLIELLANPAPRHLPAWKVPPSTLSNAGKIVILRTANAHAPAAEHKTVRERLDEGVVAVTCKEDHLRDVIWGDPVAHMMSLYAGRIEALAVGAVTARRR